MRSDRITSAGGSYPEAPGSPRATLGSGLGRTGAMAVPRWTATMTPGAYPQEEEEAEEEEDSAGVGELPAEEACFSPALVMW